MTLNAVTDLWAKNMIHNDHLDINKVFHYTIEKPKSTNSNNYAGRTVTTRNEPMVETFIGDKCVERFFFSIVYR